MLIPEPLKLPITRLLMMAALDVMVVNNIPYSVLAMVGVPSHSIIGVPNHPGCDVPSIKMVSVIV